MEAKTPMDSPLYRLSEKMMRLALVNLIWILCTVGGLIILGFFPATVALFAVLRKWEMKENVHIFPFFWETFKETFFRANIFGLIFAIAGYILYVDWLYILYYEGGSNPLIFLSTCLLSILFVVSLISMLTMFVHYELSMLNYLRNAVLFSISQPGAALMFLLSIGIVLFIIWLVPGVIPFFSMSLTGLLSTKVAHHFFRKIELSKYDGNIESDK